MSDNAESFDEMVMRLTRENDGLRRELANMQDACAEWKEAHDRLSARLSEAYPIEVRLDERGAIDEIIASGRVHLEMMDRHHVWIGVTLPSGDVMHLDITAEIPRRRKRPVIRVTRR